KAQRTQVHSEEGNISCGSHSRGRQQRAIAAQDDYEAQWLGGHLRAWNDLLSVYILGRLLIDHDTVAVFLQPEEEAGKNLRELRTSRSGDYGCGLLTICLITAAGTY